jgi:hypothetical protein
MPVSFATADASCTDATETQHCAYCGKAGATEAHRGEIFHGRCLDLVLLHHIPKHRFLARRRQKA